MKTKHVLREARVQLRRYRGKISDETAHAIETEIDKLQKAREERRKTDARKIATALVKKVRTHTPKTVWHHAIETIESLAIAIVVALLIRHFIIEPFKIPTGSMEPTLHGASANPRRSGDFIMVNKFAYGPKFPFTDRRIWTVKPKRWDIVVFKTTGIMSEDGTKLAAADPPRNFVKRIVGLPGDTLEIRDGWLYVNGERADMPEYLRTRLTDGSDRDTPYLPAPDRSHGYVKGHYLINIFGLHLLPDSTRAKQVLVGPWRFGFEGEPFTVPEGHYFMMGDNSPHSADSRAWGFVPFDNIKGRVLFVWLPPRSWRTVK